MEEISELQTQIYKQDLLIRRLNEEADRLHSQSGNCESLTSEIGLLKSRLNESENDRKELSETVTRVEKENRDLKSENQKLSNKPERIVVSYYNKCDHCSRDEYEKNLREMEKDKKSAKENHDHFYRFVNNYNTEIDNRIHKIIKRKTRFQKFADKLDHSISCINALMFFAPFLYGLAVTILAIFRNPPVRNDFISAGKAIGNVFVKMLCGLKWLELKAAEL